MKIPKTVKVGAYTYKVEFVDTLKHEGNDLLGLCDNESYTISIVKKLKPIPLKVVFLHECLHAIENVYGCVLGENKVNKFDHYLVDYLIENKLNFCE